MLFLFQQPPREKREREDNTEQSSALPDPLAALDSREDLLRSPPKEEQNNKTSSSSRHEIMTVVSPDNKRQAAVGSTMVEVSDEDLCLVLARAIGAVDPGKESLEKECESLASAGKTIEVISALIGAATETFVKKAEAGDAESGMSILAHTIAKLPQKNCDDLASKFVTAATSASTSEGASDETVEMTLAILARAYNAFPPSSKARFDTLVSTLEFAAKTKKTATLCATLKGKTDAIKKEFALEGEALRTFLYALSNVHTKAGKDSYGVLTAYLTSYGPGEITSDARAPEIARRALTELVITPDLFKCDFWSYAKDLAGVKSFAKVADLLSIVVGCDVKRAKSFCASGASTLSDLGVTEAAVVEKVQILALAKKGAEAQTKMENEIPYGEIQSSLDIAAEEVEPFLIKAIGLKILEGRMDQLHQVFKVQKTAHQVFGNQEWGTLKEKLGAMGANLADVQEKLMTTRK